MITLKCEKCGRTRPLDEDDDDEVQNAFIDGWDFAFWMDQQTICPECKNQKDFREFMEGL